MTQAHEPQPIAAAATLAPATTCESCRRPLRRGRISRVFPTWHQDCLDRAVSRAREVESDELW